MLAASVLLLSTVVYLIMPMLGFVAETTPGMRKPWAWTTVPEATQCQSGSVEPALQSIAEAACERLLAHQAGLHAPSLSAAVAINGQVVWQAAVGWADLESNTLATPDTLYRIGSTSKPVTGTVLARLVDAGLIDIDAPLSTYDTQLPNAEWADLTIRQLASHMAGLPEYGTNRDLRGLYASGALNRHHTDVRQGLALFDGSPQRYTPGSQFEYSSFGTHLLASTLQSATGQPFVELVQEWVLEPRRLNTPLPDANVSQRAQFYQLHKDKVQPWRTVDLSSKLPGGGFMSRPTDLVMLGSAWLDDNFISPATREVFWTPQQLNQGEINPQSYALTWRWHSQGQYAHHGGVSKGSMAWLAVYPDQQLVIALSTNTTLTPFSAFSSVQDELAALFTKDEPTTTHTDLSMDIADASLTKN